MNTKLSRLLAICKSINDIIIRIIGVCFVVIGAIVFLWYAYQLRKPHSTVRFNGVTTSDFGPKAIAIGMPLAVALLGISILFVKNRSKKKGKGVQLSGGTLGEQRDNDHQRDSKH
jgi:hypothetical protein